MILILNAYLGQKTIKDINFIHPLNSTMLLNNIFDTVLIDYTTLK